MAPDVEHLNKCGDLSDKFDFRRDVVFCTQEFQELLLRMHAVKNFKIVSQQFNFQKKSKNFE